MKVINKMELSCSAKSENEAFARVAVASFAAFLDPTLEEIEDLRMAVSEAVTNAIVHGYGRGYRGEDPMVTIGCTVAADAAGALLTVTVADRGVGIADVALAMRPLYTTEPGAERAGMGFTVMETFMDSVSVDSKPGEGTVVTLTKRISGITEEP